MIPFFTHLSLQKNEGKRNLGFTLIELLIVIAIVGILLTVVVINMGSAASMSVSMATQDSLRIVRYARNMALQTQQPIQILFTKGRIEILPPERKQIARETIIASDEQGSTKSSKENEKTSQVIEKDPNRLEGGAFDDIALVKYYNNVNFKFLSYNDNISYNKSKKNEHNAFERRFNPDTTPESSDEDGETSFTLTINANGTMRPCTIQVYPCDEEGNNDGAEGNTITFDFLCTGKIADEDE
jgi:prepilin-type N-terminal cleavage/methylation domain-containing protein